MEESTKDEPTGQARPKLARALTARVRRPGDKGTVLGRTVTAGLAVVLACAVAVGVGAILAHNKRTARTRNAAAQHSLRASPSPSLTTAPPTQTTAPPTHAPKKDILVPVGPGNKPARKVSHTSTGGHSGTKYQSMVTISQRTIVSYASGKCIDVTNEGQTGIPLQIWTCDPVVDWKRWAFYPDHTVRSMGKCMTVAGGSANGTPIELEPCKGGASQGFVLKSSLDLVNIAADKCVDVKNQQTVNATPLQLWQCGGTSNQKWHTGA